MTAPFPWLQDHWNRFSALEAAGRLAQGLILAGPPGLGKLEFARRMGHLLMCQETSGRPCGRCKSCLLMAAESHPDVRVFSPEDNSRVIKVDQIRDLNEFILKTPQQGHRKLAILSPAEAMNLNAANALLKTLEEPSADALLVLVTHAPGQLLPTIRSRCQLWTFALPGEQEALSWLRQQLADQQLGEQEPEALGLLRAARGAPLLALEWARAGMLEQRAQALADLAALLKREQSPFQVAARWQQRDTETLLLWFYQWLASMIAWRATGNGEAIHDESARVMLEYVARKASPMELHRLLDQVREALRSLRRQQNPNIQLLWEDLLGQWLRLIARRSESAVR